MPFKPPIPPEKIYPNANPLAIEMLQARHLVRARLRLRLRLTLRLRLRLRLRDDLPQPSY